MLGLTNPRFRVVFAVVAILSVLNLATRSQAFAESESLLWSFPFSYVNTNYSVAGLVMDTRGNLYGTTSDGGAQGAGIVFEVSPPSSIAGNWTESVLWSFGSNPTDGTYPYAGLIIDSRGNLYGTTTGGGGPLDNGTVFELTPPSTTGGNWTESILWSFGSGTDGNQPEAGLTMDANGNLYGTTSCGGTHGDNPYCSGTVFQLTPPSGSGGNWTESILWNFNGTDGLYPTSSVIMDTDGDLFGTTACGGAFGKSAYCQSGGGSGTVFELTPPSTNGGKWTESVLWSFNGSDGESPQNGIVMDHNGNLYGTTCGGGPYGRCSLFGSSGGTVFELTQSGGSWTESVIWSFGNGPDGIYPQAGLIMDASGNLDGTTKNAGAWGGGTAFELTPPASSGGSWNESILWGFGKGEDGNNLTAGLIMDTGGNLYGTTGGGGQAEVSEEVRYSKSHPVDPRLQRQLQSPLQPRSLQYHRAS